LNLLRRKWSANREGVKVIKRMEKERFGTSWELERKYTDGGGRVGAFRRKKRDEGARSCGKSWLQSEKGPSLVSKVSVDKAL